MHGIILGGILEREDSSESRNQLVSQQDKEKPPYWPSIKRSAGAHFQRRQGGRVDVPRCERAKYSGRVGGEEMRQWVHELHPKAGEVRRAELREEWRQLRGC